MATKEGMVPVAALPAVSTAEEEHDAALLDLMPPPLRKVATVFKKKFDDAAWVGIIVHYDLGVQVKNILANEGVFGTDALKQLAAYLRYQGDAAGLAEVRDFANMFNRPFVKAWSERPFTNGGYLTLKHWMQLTHLKTEADQQRMLETTIAQSLTSNQLEQQIQAGGLQLRNVRKGGRHPTTPSNPMIGVQRVFQISNQLVNYEKVSEASIFTKLEQMPPDKVDKSVIASVAKTLKSLGEASTAVTTMKSRGRAIQAHFTKIMQSRKGEKGAEAEANGAADEKPASKKKKTKKKPVKPGKVARRKQAASAETDAEVDAAAATS